MLTPHDQKLIDEAIKDAEAAFSKRKAEFLADLGITTGQYDEAAGVHSLYVADRPKGLVLNSPIARESFITGYIYASIRT